MPCSIDARLTLTSILKVPESEDASRRPKVSYSVCSVRICARENLSGRRKSYGLTGRSGAWLASAAGVTSCPFSTADSSASISDCVRICVSAMSQPPTFGLNPFVRMTAMAFLHHIRERSLHHEVVEDDVAHSLLAARQGGIEFGDQLLAERLFPCRRGQVASRLTANACRQDVVERGERARVIGHESGFELAQRVPLGLGERAFLVDKLDLDRELEVLEAARAAGQIEHSTRHVQVGAWDRFRRHARGKLGGAGRGGRLRFGRSRGARRRACRRSRLARQLGHHEEKQHCQQAMMPTRMTMLRTL